MLTTGVPLYTAVTKAICSAAQPLSKITRLRIALLAAWSQVPACRVPVLDSKALRQMVLVWVGGIINANEADEAESASAEIVFFMVNSLRHVLNNEALGEEG